MIQGFDPAGLQRGLCGIRAEDRPGRCVEAVGGDAIDRCLPLHGRHPAVGDTPYACPRERPGRRKQPSVGHATRMDEPMWGFDEVSVCGFPDSGSGRNIDEQPGGHRFIMGRAVRDRARYDEHDPHCDDSVHASSIVHLLAMVG